MTGAIKLARRMWDATNKMIEEWELKTLEVFSSSSSTKPILHEIYKCKSTAVLEIEKIQRVNEE